MDFKELGANLGLELSEFRELVELFLATAKKDLQKILDAYQAGDCKTVAGSAHSLKGASGNLGFSELSLLAKQVESKGTEETLSALDGIIDAIRHQIDIIAACLETSG